MGFRNIHTFVRMTLVNNLKRDIVFVCECLAQNFKFLNDAAPFIQYSIPFFVFMFLGCFKVMNSVT